MEKLEFSYIAGWMVKLSSYTEESLAILQNVQYRDTMLLSNPPSPVCGKKNENTCWHKRVHERNENMWTQKMCTQMFTAALFMTAEKWKNNVLVSCGCCIQLPQSWWLKKQIYFLTFLEAPNCHTQVSIFPSGVNCHYESVVCLVWNK